jgi:hypothetical protein
LERANKHAEPANKIALAKASVEAHKACIEHGLNRKNHLGEYVNHKAKLVAELNSHDGGRRWADVSAGTATLRREPI